MGSRQGLKRLTRLSTALALLATILLAGTASFSAQTEAYPLTFPVAGDNSWTDTWGASRSEGRTHKGTDIFADKGTPVVAAAAGTVTRITEGERAGRYIVIKHDDGWTSYYLHLDNDTPGTDDGLGGAPAEGIAVGVRVEAGDVIDCVGDSGNAEGTSSHLHFELHQPDGTAINPAPHLRSALTGEPIDPTTVQAASAAAVIRYQASGTELVGHVDPGDGFAAGLAVHQGIVYMGTWGRPNACPNSGVRIIDATDPQAPVVLGALAGAEEFPETSTDGVWVGAIDTEAFAGDLAVVGVRLCDTSERTRRGDAFRGLALYDVSDPADPVLLSTVDSGELTQGVNDVTGAVRPDGTVVVSVTVMQSYRHTEGALGDWRLIDVTDPTDPVQLADWDYRATLPDDDPTARDVDLHAHTTTLAADGTNVWVAVWDAGLVNLDLTDTETPVVVAHVPIGETGEGNAHSVVIDPESGLLIRNDEDLEWRTEDGTVGAWGGQTLYDASDLSDITLLGSYATDNSDLTDGEPAGAGYYSAHEIVLVNDIEYLSWYSDGVRIVDVSDPAQPEEIGHFVPPPTADPQQHFRGQGRGSDFAMVWSVKIADGLIYMSDMNSGLWIVRLGSGDETAEDAAAL